MIGTSLTIAMSLITTLINSSLVPPAGCCPPSPPSNGSVNEYLSGSVGAMLTFQCNTGYIPHEQVTSTCLENGSWVPIPQCVLAGMYEC